MTETKLTGLPVLLLSLSVAFVLATIPLPGILALMRPEWVLLVLLYWLIALPDRIGLITAWTVGLLVDLVAGGLLGQHALTYVLAAFFAVSLHQQFRMFSLIQQTLLIGTALVVYQLIDASISQISGNASFQMLDFLPVLSSTVMWPAVFVLLRSIRRRYRVA